MVTAMDKQLKAVVKDLVDEFGAEETAFRGQVKLILPPEHIVAVSKRLRDTHKFERLAAITAVDYWPEQNPRFHLVYQFHSIDNHLRLEVRLPLIGNLLEIDTLSGVYPTANWLERELWDMFGIRAQGHPDLRRLLMPFDWEGHPLRKDYPLGYEEVQFSFNYEEIAKRKPRPKD